MQNFAPESQAQGSDRASALVSVNRPLQLWVRALCAALGTALVGSGGAAVFLTPNEIGSATLLAMGALFVVIALVGHVPRLKWGSAEVDPALLFAAGVAQGAESVTEAAQGILATAPADEDVSEALEAVATEVTSREIRRAVGRSLPSDANMEQVATLDEQARDLGVTRERVRHLRSRARELGLGSVPLDVVLNLGRLAAYDGSVDHHSVAREMANLGYSAYAPQSRAAASDSAAYIRWLYQGAGQTTVRLYQNSAGLISDSRPQYGFALTLPGAEPEGGMHPKVRYYYSNSSVDTVLEAARAFKEFADRP